MRLWERLLAEDFAVWSLGVTHIVLEVVLHLCSVSKLIWCPRVTFGGIITWFIVRVLWNAKTLFKSPLVKEF